MRAGSNPRPGEAQPRITLKVSVRALEEIDGRGEVALLGLDLGQRESTLQRPAVEFENVFENLLCPLRLTGVVQGVDQESLQLPIVGVFRDQLLDHVHDVVEASLALVKLSQGEHPLDVSRVDLPKLLEGTESPLGGLGVAVDQRQLGLAIDAEHVHGIGGNIEGRGGLLSRLLEPPHATQDLGVFDAQIRGVGIVGDRLIEQLDRLFGLSFVGQQASQGKEVRSLLRRFYGRRGKKASGKRKRAENPQHCARR